MQAADLRDRVIEQICELTRTRQEGIANGEPRFPLAEGAFV